MIHLDAPALDALNLSAQDIVASLEKAIRGSRANTVWAAPKAVMHPPDGRYIMATLASMNAPPLVATKSLVLNAANSANNLPQINGIVSLLHGETGAPLATIDGPWITAVRTAGLSALAAKYMALPASSSVGFVGTGVQAQSHLRLYADMFPLSHIKISGRGQKNIDALCHLAQKLGLSAQVCTTPQEAVQQVDMVVSSVTHTQIKQPYLRSSWLKHGCFVSSVDLGLSWHPDSMDTFDQRIIDDCTQEAALPNKLLDPALVDGDLAGLVTAEIQGRGNATERTAFIFRGHALGDLAVSALVYERTS